MGDWLTERFTAFGDEVTAAVRPRPASAVRARADRRRIGFAAGAALVAGGLAAAGTTAVLAGSGGGGGEGTPFPAGAHTLLAETLPGFTRSDDPAAPAAYTACGPDGTRAGRVTATTVTGTISSAYIGNAGRDNDGSFVWAPPTIGPLALPFVPEAYGDPSTNPSPYPAGPLVDFQPPHQVRITEQLLAYDTAAAADQAYASLRANPTPCGWAAIPDNEFEFFTTKPDTYVDVMIRGKLVHLTVIVSDPAPPAGGPALVVLFYEQMNRDLCGTDNVCPARSDPSAVPNMPR